jgi:LemA protein
MTMGMILGIVAVSAALIIIGWIVVGYNRLVHLKALIDEGWSGIDVQLKRRYDLIPNLVTLVKGYAIHEKEVLENVVRMRAVSIGAATVQDKAAAEAELTQTLKTLFAVAENYPNLKANENFLALQKELSTIEHEVQLSRRYYNGTVRNYMIAIIQFPVRIIAQLFGFTRLPYFELSASHERDVPKIQL